MIGETLGSYQVISEIGSGGMGVVYLAKHVVLGREAAVKVLRAEMPREFVERFFTEAKAAATLRHPSLVDVFDFGHHTDGRAFIVMEYLQGESLAQRLEHEPRLPVALACTIARSVANALHVAHEGGIIHRDLKPGNTFLVPDADAPGGLRTKVLDFGIAKLVHATGDRAAQTASGAVMGTPRYMSPEQCKNAREVDGRSDIYSLGCILYEMLLGVAPFDYDSWAELVGAHIYEVPRTPSEIDPNLPADVTAVVTRMLEKAPEDRFQDMPSLALALEELILTHGEARIRLTPPAGRIVATPARGNRINDSGQDATLPAAAGQTAAVNDSRRGPGAIAPTMPAQAGPIAASSRSGKKPPWIAIGLAVAGLVGLAVAATLAFTKDRSSTNETAYIVVDQRGSGAVGSASVAPGPVDAPGAIDAGVAAAVVSPEAGVRTPASAGKRPTEPDLVQLERTFGRQTAAISGCYTTHGQPNESIDVRFQIDTAGRVRTAVVLPAAVAATPLGACIAKLARTTSFGPQPKALAFRVPLVVAQ